MSLAISNSRRAHLHAKAMAAPPSEDIAVELNRVLRLRGMTVGDLAKATRLTERHWFYRLSHPYCRVTPGLLKLFLAAIDATPAECRRLHQLGARADGWEV